ncbi:MAG: chorismate mutase [Cyanobacteria bacterium]|nr:chorismate mutase [Cyanobacteriota bacterium]
MPRIRGVRGATTPIDSSPNACEEALIPLLTQLVAENRIELDDIVSVFFTVTDDLPEISPAKIARLSLGWTTIPMMCSKEPEIKGLPPRCIRVLIQFYTHLPSSALCPIYLENAQGLRPDLIK